MSDGRYHSGADLGALLGVSRTAVWKHLQKLEGLGLPLETVKGKGYRVPGGVELLQKAVIESSLDAPARSFLSELDIVHSVDSTSTRAMNRVAEGGAHGYVCLAEHQAQGRGRRGRTWVSPFGQNLYLSAVVEFTEGAAALEGLSLAVGVGLIRAMRGVGVTDVGLKWPNDVLHDGRKLAGILLEMTGDPSGVCQVVVGVGVNVAMTADVSGQIDQPWIDLLSLNPDLSRNEFAAALLNHLLPLLQGFHSNGFADYQKEWEALSVYSGNLVRLQTGGAGFVEGVVLGVTQAGALRLEVAGEEQVFSGGEISLRPVVL
jgi:BirA family biotin operon repressor/biotin-[acetyl-CoA-carboxylase] ligase